MSEQMKPAVKCKHCGATYPPDTRTKGPWVCPKCSGKNPNLKRLYRSVADLFILGVIAAGIILLVGFRNRGMDATWVLQAATGLLLLAAIVIIYRSRTPWKDKAVGWFVWVPVVVAALGNVAVPLVLTGAVFVPYVVVYILVFLYLGWLAWQSKKCAV